MNFSNPFDFWMALFLAICVALIVYGITLVSVLCWLERRALYRKTRLTRSQKARLARKSMRGKVI